MKKLIFIFVTTLGIVNTACAQNQSHSSTSKDVVELHGQVFLRNQFGFTDNRQSQGASSSFIEKNGEIYILTAKHLLGTDMGISPAVKPTSFSKELKSWTVSHNDDQTVLANITSIYKPNDNEEEDIIMLKTDASLEDIKPMTLPISYVTPKMGEYLFGIGCPYREGNSCKQNLYPGKVVLIENNVIAIKTDSPPNSISGFSGAALVNSKAEIVAVIYGGGDGYLVGTLLPNWISN